MMGFVQLAVGQFGADENTVSCEDVLEAASADWQI